MLAIILAGGFATRLRPLTLTKPKALLPILNRPLLDWILEQLKRANIKDVVLSIRYLSDMIKSRYGDGSMYGVSIQYVEEVMPLGDAGPLRLVDEIIGLNSTFLVIYGDVFSDVDISKVMEFHRKKGGIATLTLVYVDDPSRYGIVSIDEENRILNFVEKPRREEAPSNLANAGIYVFEPEVLKFIPKDRPSKLAKDVIPRLVNEDLVYGYIHNGIWNDIGVPEDYIKANMQALTKYYPEGYIDPSAIIDKDVEILHPVFIDRNVRIGRYCRIGPYTIIGSSSDIRNGVRIRNSILFSNVIVEPYSYVDGAIIGDKTYIGRWVRIEKGAILGDQVVIHNEVYIAQNVIVLPFKEIDTSIYDCGKVVL